MKTGSSTCSTRLLLLLPTAGPPDRPTARPPGRPTARPPDRPTAYAAGFGFPRPPRRRGRPFFGAAPSVDTAGSAALARPRPPLGASTRLAVLPSCRLAESSSSEMTPTSGIAALIIPLRVPRRGPSDRGAAGGGGTST